MTTDTSILGLIMEASLVVQLVMLILLIASVVSWTMIVSKWKIIRDARVSADNFEDRFWSGTDLAALYEKVRVKKDPTGMEGIFLAGFKEYVRLHRQQRVSPDAITDTALRSMKVAMAREVEVLRTLSFFSSYRGFHCALYRFVWHSLGNYEFISCLRRCATSNTFCSCTWNC